MDYFFLLYKRYMKHKLRCNTAQTLRQSRMEAARHTWPHSCKLPKGKDAAINISYLCILVL